MPLRFQSPNIPAILPPVRVVKRPSGISKYRPPRCQQCESVPVESKIRWCQSKFPVPFSKDPMKISQIYVKIPVSDSSNLKSFSLPAFWIDCHFLDLTKQVCLVARLLAPMATHKVVPQSSTDLVQPQWDQFIWSSHKFRRKQGTNSKTFVEVWTLADILCKIATIYFWSWVWAAWEFSSLGCANKLLSLIVPQFGRFLYFTSTLPTWNWKASHSENF